MDQVKFFKGCLSQKDSPLLNALANIEAYLRTCQTSMLKFFAKIVDGRKPNIKPSFSQANILVITWLVVKNTR